MAKNQLLNKENVLKNFVKELRPTILFQRAGNKIINEKRLSSKHLSDKEKEEPDIRL